ncbi:MAG: hypothetical protein ACKVLI_02355 [Alphaproteobacteria bacterium]|jgi:hypothetical protein|tara:strand:- start:41342 stop:41869 length:528 start_codon:yes stop_codon:yes gene_type:complete
MLKIKILYKILILSIATFVIFLLQFRHVDGGELLDLANEHVDVYLVDTVINTMKPLIAEKVLKDIESLDLLLPKDESKIIAEKIAISTVSRMKEDIPKIASKTMIKYFTKNDIEKLTEIYSLDSDNGILFAKKSYLYQSELAQKISLYIYANMEEIVTEVIDDIVTNQVDVNILK